MYVWRSFLCTSFVDLSGLLARGFVCMRGEEGKGRLISNGCWMGILFFFFFFSFLSFGMACYVLHTIIYIAYLLPCLTWLYVFFSEWREAQSTYNMKVLLVSVACTMI